MTALAKQTATVTALHPKSQARPLPSPRALRERFALSHTLMQQIQAQRQHIRRILSGEDTRLLVVVGPCSLHDEKAVLDYADRLAALAPRVEDQLLLVMRAYVEKPRTTVGWKGLVYDPDLSGECDLAKGLSRSRELMLKLVERGLPLANELLQPMIVPYLEDLMSWAAIGARTSESQVHREMVSGLDLPVGFKNGTDGSLSIAADAIRSAAHSHHHFGLDNDGRPAQRITAGNADTHIVLRGGHSGPNYGANAVAEVMQAIEKAQLPSAIMVDCSHANSNKDPSRQPAVLQNVIDQRVAGNHQLRAVMLESHINNGNQPISCNLSYGVSITDGCLGWSEPDTALLTTAERLRRA